MCRIAAKICGDEEERKESTIFTKHIAVSNGYNAARSHSQAQELWSSRSKSPNNTRYRLRCHLLPVQASTAIRWCLKRVKLDDLVTRLELLQNNPIRQLVRKRFYYRFCRPSNCVICPKGNSGDCMSSDLIPDHLLIHRVASSTLSDGSGRRLSWQ